MQTSQEKVQSKFPDGICFLIGDVVPSVLRSSKTVEDITKEGFKSVGNAAKQPYDPKIGYPLGRQPARLAMILVNNANPDGLIYDGVVVSVKGNELELQPYKK